MSDDYCDGSCLDALGNAACCVICLTEICRCGHMMGQHEYGDALCPCEHCRCRVFQTASVGACRDNESEQT